MSRLRTYWNNIFAKRKNQTQVRFNPFQIKRFFHSIISKSNPDSAKYTSQRWRLTWLVYKSLMFRPANLILLSSQAVLFSVIPKPQFLDKKSNQTSNGEKFQEIFQRKINEGSNNSIVKKKDSIDQKIDELIVQKTLDDVLEMVDTDERMDELLMAKDIAKENQKIYEQEKSSVDEEIDNTSMVDFTGFESTVDSIKGENIFNEFKFKITEAMLNLTPLKSVNELDTFSNYLDHLKYNDRVILNKETQLGQKLALQLKDFFFMYSLAQHLNLTDLNSVEMEKQFFLGSNKQFANFRDLQYEKISDTAKEDLVHMKKEKKLLKESIKKNKTKITMDESDGSLSFSKGNLEPYVYNESAKAGWFFRTWRHYQSKNMLTWEQFWERSKDIDILIKQNNTDFSYNNIIDYLNKFINTGIQETSQIIKIYELIPKNDLYLKEAFTRWIVVNQKNLDHIIQKKKNNHENSNILIKNEPLVINMIDSIMKSESYKPNERWESLLKFLKFMNIKNKSDEPQQRIKKRRLVRSLSFVNPIQNLNSDNKQQLKNQKNIEVSLPIFMKLLEKTIELDKQTQSLRLIDCMKNGIKTIHKSNDQNCVKENEILIDLTSYFYKVNEVSTDETWLRYDDNLMDIIKLNQKKKDSNDEDENYRDTLVKLVCDNTDFKKCIEHMRTNTKL